MKMSWKHWLGIALGAGAGLAIAWGLHQFAEYADAAVDEAEGGIVY